MAPVDIAKRRILPASGRRPMGEKSVDELYQHTLDLLYREKKPLAAL